MSEWKQKVLVTAGSTQMPIDKVRVITNIFKGKTGAAIASYFVRRGHDVTLLTSSEGPALAQQRFQYKTYDELAEHMQREILTGHYDIIIHSAAVSDYRVQEVWVKNDYTNNLPVHLNAKIPSQYSELFLKLVPTEKLIDKIREDWGFKGALVKFKLEVDLLDTDLLRQAFHSLEVSQANFIVANCLETAREKAFIIDKFGHYMEVIREELPMNLHRALLDFPSTLRRLAECKL
jgi:phosphopantothenoylcysteine synthetase/decarboxylase